MAKSCFTVRHTSPSVA